MTFELSATVVCLSANHTLTHTHTHTHHTHTHTYLFHLFFYFSKYMCVSTQCALYSVYGTVKNSFVKLHQMTYKCVQKKQNSALTFDMTTISSITKDKNCVPASDLAHACNEQSRVRICNIQDLAKYRLLFASNQRM